MKIGGLQPVTLLDYPGLVAATIFTSGCNMRCPFCYNPGLVLPQLIVKDGGLPEKELFDFLKQRKKYLDGVCITGGEPLLQPDIVNFCVKIKKLGYLIKLDTNGLQPKKLAKLIDKKLIDYIAMDIKGPVGNYQKYVGATVDTDKVKKSIAIIKDSGLAYEFRSTLAKGLHQKEDILAMAEMIRGAKKYFIQNFTAPEMCVDRNFKGTPFTQAEMIEFQVVAKKAVADCQLR